MAKEKNAPIVLRTITAGNAKKGIFRAKLIAVSNNVRQILIEKQTQKDIEIENEETVIKTVKKLIVYPDYEGLKEPEAKKRAAAVEEYIEENGVAEALEDVGKEVVTAKKKTVPKNASEDVKKEIEEFNKNLPETVIEWQPKIEKDLGFKIKTRYEQVPREETVISITNEVQFTHKKVHSIDLHYRIKPRDFIKYVHNFLNERD